MLPRLLLTLGLIALTLAAPAWADDTPSPSQTPTGRWITASGDAVVQIAPCGANLCGQIVGIQLAHPGDPMPTNWQGQPQCGETIIQTTETSDANGQPVWKGTVLDPRNGNIYQARIKLDQSRHLELHGYLGLPIFGQTQTWTPFAGRTMADCHLADNSAPPSNG